MATPFDAITYRLRFNISISERKVRGQVDTIVSKSKILEFFLFSDFRIRKI